MYAKIGVGGSTADKSGVPEVDSCAAQMSLNNIQGHSYNLSDQIISNTDLAGRPDRPGQGCRRPARPARSACQAGHLAWPGRPDRDLTGRQAGIHPLIIINY